jgi:hypothetical protein
VLEKDISNDINSARSPAVDITTPRESQSKVSSWEVSTEVCIADAPYTLTFHASSSVVYLQICNWSGYIQKLLDRTTNCYEFIECLFIDLQTVLQPATLTLKLSNKTDPSNTTLVTKSFKMVDEDKEKKPTKRTRRE